MRVRVRVRGEWTESAALCLLCCLCLLSSALGFSIPSSLFLSSFHSLSLSSTNINSPHYFGHLLLPLFSSFSAFFFPFFSTFVLVISHLSVFHSAVIYGRSLFICSYLYLAFFFFQTFLGQNYCVFGLVSSKKIFFNFLK